MNTTAPHTVNGTLEEATEKPTEDIDPEAYLYDIGAMMHSVAILTLFCVGCSGNLLTFIVSVRKNQRRSPVSIFLAALAVSDTIVLVLDFINNWVRHTLNVNLLKGLGLCLMNRWFLRVAFTTSSWLVAGVAVERLIAVFYPLSAKVYCTVKNTVIAVIAIPTILTMTYMYNVFMWEIHEDRCDVKPYYDYFISMISPWILYSLYSYAPLMIIVVCNIAIVFRLTRSDQARSAMSTSTGSESRKVTIMVLTICVYFICATVPLSVWYLWIFNTRQFITQTARITFIQIVIQIVGSSNYCINFFLYALTSQRFRAELKLMFSCSSEANNMAGLPRAGNLPAAHIQNPE